MSSPKSRRRTAPRSTEHLASVREALMDVANHSFFAMAENCDRVRFEELAPRHGGWLQASVAFDGAFRGALDLTLPESLAGELLVSFLGAYPDSPATEREVLDMTGEFANMVCGTWLSRACRRRRFDLESPAVSKLSAGWGPDDPPAQIFAFLNSSPVGIRLALAGDAV